MYKKSLLKGTKLEEKLKEEKIVDVQNYEVALSEEEISLIKAKFGTNLMLLRHAAAALLQLSADSTKLIVKGPESNATNVKHFLRIMVERRNLESAPIDTQCIHADMKSILDIPSDCVAFISGYKNSNLRNLEEEFGTLLFIQPQMSSSSAASTSSSDSASASISQSAAPTETQCLYILGPTKNRVGTLLRIMSQMSVMHSSSFLDGDASANKIVAMFSKMFPTLRWSVMSLTPKVMGFFIGRDGNLIRKISRASNCAIEAFKGDIVCIGPKEPLRRALNYIEILKAQQSRQRKVEVNQNRNDITVIIVNGEPSWLIGEKGLGLREVERQTKTFIFVEKKLSYFMINILGYDASLRSKAKTIVKEMISEREEKTNEIKKKEAAAAAATVAWSVNKADKNKSFKELLLKV